MFKELDSILIILTAISLAFILALWISLIIWTIRDIRQRTKDRLFYFLAALSVVVFNFPGFLIYLILRPKHTFNDYYQQALEEEALLQSIEGFGTCPNCGHEIKPNWKFCPYCEHKLAEACEACGELLKPDWITCPYCGTPRQTSEIENNDAAPQEENMSSDSFDDIEFTSLETETPNDDMFLEEEEFDSFEDD